MRNQKAQYTKNRQEILQTQTKVEGSLKQKLYESINTENAPSPNKACAFRYEKQYGQDHWLISGIWFWPYVTYSYQLWKNVTKKNSHITLEHLPKISQDESIEEPLRRARVAIHQYQQQKSKINNIDLIIIIFTKSLRYNVFMATFNYFIQGILKCAISIFISAFLNLVLDGEITNAYLIALLITVLNFLQLVICNHGFAQSERFSCRCRMLIINVVYQKLLHLTPYSIKEANVGRILNLISGDIAILESLLSLLLQALVAPITVLIAAGILWAQFGGPIGLLAIAIIFLAYPMQLLINRFNMPNIWKSKVCSDTRLKLTNELIDGIRLIKMYAWEKAFDKMITQVRSNENMNYILIQIRTGLDRTFSLTSQLWGSMIFFLILQYGGFEDTLNVPDMIAAIQLLSYIKFACVYFVSLGLLALTMVRISFERIANIINLENYEMKALDPISVDKESEYGIELRNFSAFWKGVVDESTKPVLKEINLQIKEGELWAVVGRVGSGKSSLLNALLLEIPSYRGSLKIYGKEAKRGDMNAAYVEQEPFIFPDSVKKNILFGREFNSELYQSVCEASCLIDDINQMKYRDETEIGEKGINLSGGQKARLSLARALYQVADIYLFDDPLSAVDAKVAQQIFSKAIKDFIFKKQSEFSKSSKKPMVVLITHQIQYAIECDNIAILEDGCLVSQGKYEQVKNNLTMISEELAKQFQDSKDAKLDQQNKIKIDVIEDKHQEDQQDDEVLIEEDKQQQTIKEHNLIGHEEEQRTAVTIHTLQRYFRYWNKVIIIIIVLQNIISEVIFNLYYRIISTYDEYQNQNDINSGQLTMGMLILGFLINNFIKYTLNTVTVQATSKQIHQEMLSSVMQAPTSYFDTNPTGRIINKFSNDLSLADNQTIVVLLDIQEILFNFFISLITLVILEPFFIILIVFILSADCFLFLANKNQMLQLKELELMRKSPIFDFLKKTIDGVTQMRIYKKEKWFEEQYFELSQQSVMSACAYYNAGRVLTFFMDMTGWVVQLVGIFMTLKLDSEDQGILSQVILMLVVFNDSINWALRQMIIFETQLTSYNRMFNTIDIKAEAPHHVQGDDKIEFPKTGDISMKNVYMRYRDNCDLVLKGLTLSIKEGEKIGCVGRTGAGKSSILQILFRMVEIEKREESQLEIGSQDIRALGLNKLRSNIAIIPQTPFLFTGTIKRNLDPFSEKKEEELWKALEQTDLRDYVERLEKKLDTDMSDVNSVFSVGQKQLICLARVLLNKRKIIVLDEATANVDMKTDDFIQETIKEMFQGCTIITIAHRLNTIADYDKVIVMKDGVVAEFDSPYQLLQNKDSEFSKMVASTGEYNANAITKIATNNYNKC